VDWFQSFSSIKINEMQGKKLGNLVASAGVLGVIFYGIGKQKDFGTILLYGALFGVGGYLLGNSVQRFYE
jgi:cell division protein FtsW (lipid II flippase)